MCQFTRNDNRGHTLRTLRGTALQFFFELDSGEGFPEKPNNWFMLNVSLNEYGQAGQDPQAA